MPASSDNSHSEHSLAWTFNTAFTTEMQIICIIP